MVRPDAAGRAGILLTVRASGLRRHGFDLLAPGAVVTHSIPQSDRPVLALSILGTLIYAPTAAVLHQFVCPEWGRGM